MSQPVKTLNEVKEACDASLETAYWNFDNARNQKTRSERDCFKANVRGVVHEHLLQLKKLQPSQLKAYFEEIK
ncbi:MAG: hypothetical protein ACRDBQ_18250 [Shewanella sp.]